jgi:glycosyltransferase involved in cell wall biosynthesis
MSNQAHHTWFETMYRNTRREEDGAIQQHDQETQHHSSLRTPFFSVIICTYNRRNMILTALASLRKQTLLYEHFEVIVVDNGSSDGTFNAVQTYFSADRIHPRREQGTLRTQCLLEQHNGLAYARNTGLTAASGEVIVFLDDDVIVDSHFLERLLVAYQETHADAIGGCVDLHWEAPRPYWFSDEMLETLGLYMPFRIRSPLPSSQNFSNRCFSVRHSALQKVGAFSPFMSKQWETPIDVEVTDLCRRLRQEGYHLWYEPSAQVLHRIAQARLERAFIIERAYWQGRSEILVDAADVEHYQDAAGSSFIATLRSIVPALGTMLFMVIHRLLLYLIRRPMSERIHAAMAQARCWGRIQQQFMLSNHAPATSNIPFLLVVRAHEQDAVFLIRALQTTGVYHTSSIADIPLGWLWRHRAHQEIAIGVINLYRPGAFQLNHWQRQRLLAKLWLAQCLGIRITSTDAGGWWQNVRHLRFRQRRNFERHIFACSQVIHTFTRHPEQFYSEYSWRHRVRYFAHPGLRGALPALESPSSPAHGIQRHTNEKCRQFRTLLGITEQAGFVYLCFAHMHSEREILHLMGAFITMRAMMQQSLEHIPAPQLLLIGVPPDKKRSQKILQRAAFNTAIHLFSSSRYEDLETYVGAANALVMPYSTNKTAGVTDTAILFYSYERLVIVPEIPRFYGLLPPYATIQYKSSSLTSLTQALLMAQSSEYRHTQQEKEALDGTRGWINYVRYMMDTYKQLLTIT